MREVHSAIASHKCVLEIDEALSAGDYHKLMEIANIRTFGALLKNDLDSKYEQCNDSECGDSVLRQPDLEEQLVLTHATLITERLMTSQSMCVVVVTVLIKGNPYQWLGSLIISTVMYGLI